MKELPRLQLRIDDRFLDLGTSLECLWSEGELLRPGDEFTRSESEWSPKWPTSPIRSGDQFAVTLAESRELIRLMRRRKTITLDERQALLTSVGIGCSPFSADEKRLAELRGVDDVRIVIIEWVER